MVAEPFELQPYPADHKRCSVCRVLKPLSVFRWSNQARGELISACRDCMGPRDQAQRNSRKANGKARAYNIARGPRMYAAKLVKVFGMTMDEYRTILAAQGGRCAICREKETATIGKTGTVRMLAVDHNHATGTNRGLLCSRCNNGLGYFRDRPDILAQAIAYLNAHKTQIAHSTGE